MPSQGSITKTIRLSAEDRAVIEQIMEEEGVTWSGAIHTLIAEGVPKKNIKDGEGCTPNKDMEGVPQTINEDTLAALEGMCRPSGITLRSFMDRIRDMFNDGDIYVDGITLKTKGECDLRYLLEACHRANVDPQEMINKLANSLVRR